MMSVREWLPVLLPLIALQVVLMVAALIDLLRREPARVRGPKWVWGLVVVFISTIGPIAYFVAGRQE